MHDGDVSAAVIFDLFGTLTGFESQRDAQAASLADLLGVPVEALTGRLRESYDERARGGLGDIRDQVAMLARQSGSSPSAVELDRASSSFAWPASGPYCNRDREQSRCSLSCGPAG